MGDNKLYQTPTPYNNFYNRAPCAKQVLEPSTHQQFYPYNTLNQVNPLENFNVVATQNCHKANIYSYTTNQSSQEWDPIADPMKISDKIEMIEISSKDLSPVSYCNNFEFYMSDFYKNFGKELNYYNTSASQWFPNSGTQKSEYSSCAQLNLNANIQHDNANSNSASSKTVKYCSIQNINLHQPQNHRPITNNTHQDFEYTNSDLSYQQQAYSSSYYSASLGPNSSFVNENKTAESLSRGQFFDLPIPIGNENFPPLDQQTDISNEESDIIVEDSDEDLELDKNPPSEGDTKCIICNISYTPMGRQFYYLTLKSPLTMSTQKPVFTKIVNLTRHKFQKKIKYLCRDCLSLINTIDHLQLKLENYKKDLMAKFMKSCVENNVEHRLIRKQNVHKCLSVDCRMRCKQCRKILSMQLMCRAHLKKHKMRGFLCELCGEICKNQCKFKMHRIKHAPRIPKIEAFQCTNCEKTFRTKSNLAEHENSCLGLLPFACKLCDKRLPSSSKLKNHIKLKHDKKFIAICSICNIGFVKLSDYKSHKTSHSTDKKFACNKCDKAYKTLSNLNFHMKSHSDSLPFICATCGKGFMRKEYLEAHVNNHNGVKNFSCSVCDKKFVSQKNLDAHHKYHEGTVKTRSCNVCGKVMATGLEEHMRLHNNLMEYVCDICDCRFNTKGTLAKHKKRKHSSKIC